MTSTYQFEGGYPSADTVRAAYDDAAYIRAVQAYKYFFPTVSGEMINRGNEAVGMAANTVFGTMETGPQHAGLTLNSDTPYAPIMLDLSGGPLVIEMPAGPLMGVMLDIDQGCVADMGISGPDGGHGGAYVLAPPEWDGQVPDGYYLARAASYRINGGVRAIPRQGDVAGALALLRQVRVRPLDPARQWAEPTWMEVGPQDSTPNAVQGTFAYWEVLAAVVAREPVNPVHRIMYGELAALGITKGAPFAPDERLRAILTRAAADADAHMRVQSLADQRPDRVLWPDRTWEYVTLRPENSTFDIDGYLDTVAREVWFYQAIASSPAMFRRQAGGGSVYWFSGRDAAGNWLDGGQHYTLSVPLPVPAGLFWSVTVYDAQTRSQIAAPQGRAALRSLFELASLPDAGPAVLHFGPSCPAGEEDRWVQTIPGRGWFVYLRLYGPSAAAFDGTWRPGDFERA